MAHIQTHRKAYEAFAARDFEAALKDLADDAVLHGVAKGLPFGDDYKGRDAIMKEWLPAIGETLEDLVLDPAKFIEDGDWVIVLGHESYSVDGTAITHDFAHVWRWESGEIVEAWFYGDGAQVAAALR
jgi:ketosteroid isomerase-like protein